MARSDKIFNILFVAAVITIAFFVVRTGYVESAEVIELKAINVRLNADITLNQQNISAEKLKREFFQEKAESLEKKNDSLKVSISALRDSYDDIGENVGKIPKDSIYSLLDAHVYPTGEVDKPYPFSAGQITSIYITKIEHDTLLVLSSVLFARIANQEEQLANKDSVIFVSNGIISTQDTIIADYRIITLNDSVIIRLQESKLQKSKSEKRIWQIGAGVATLLLIVSVL